MERGAAIHSNVITGKLEQQKKNREKVKDVLALKAVCQLSTSQIGYSTTQPGGSSDPHHPPLPSARWGGCVRS